MPAKKISSQILELRGSFDKHPDRRRHGEPQLPPARPDPPEHLTAPGRLHWNRLVDQLYEAGIMTALDVDALAAYCEAYARWLDACKHLEQVGAIIKDKDGLPRHSPYLRVAQDSFHQFRALLGELGMTPAGRAGLSVAPAKTENPFAQFDRTPRR